MNRYRLAALVVALLVIAGAAFAQPLADETALKQRFAERYVTLLRLKDLGRVGESSIGFAQAVQPEYLVERIDADDEKSDTIAKFLSDENLDRKQLYVLIAKKSSTKEDLVARRNAQRLFAKAAPHHYLKLPDGRWVQQRDMKKAAAR